MNMRERGEREFIRRLARFMGGGAGVRIGIGDDAAVAAAPADCELLLTSDAVIEGVHFLAGEDAERVGNKAAGRVLSDLAAMGAHPLWALVNLSAPSEADADWLERMMRALNNRASEFGMAVIGGDVARSVEIAVHVFAVGHAPTGTAMPRSAVRVGDALFVTGDLGGSLAGRHLDFAPRIAEGLWLRERGTVRAAIDVTDGLATDALHLARESGVTLELHADLVPCSRAAVEAADGSGPLHRALYDGEDFELLFSVPSADAPALERAWRETFVTKLTRIGAAAAGPARVILIGPDGTRSALEDGGFDHFVAGASPPNP